MDGGREHAPPGARSFALRTAPALAAALVVPHRAPSLGERTPERRPLPLPPRLGGGAPLCQVWNKKVKPSPKVGLQGSWQPVDELHAVLVHCDTWTPRFDGLRGNVVPLGPVASSHGDRASRHFHENVVHYSELLIKEKPPEMSKKKRKKPEDGSAAPDDGHATPHYRMMFSLYRRDVAAAPINPNPAPGEEAPAMPEGKHLTFCMAPEDILIRNSFHMLSEGEKETRRAEYKSKQSAPKPKPTAPLGIGATAVGVMPTLGAGQMPAGAMALVADGSQMAGALPQALVSQPIELLPAAASAAVEPTGAGAPLLGALSATTGHVAGGTPVWLQGSRFSTRTRVYFGSAAATEVHPCNDSLITVVAPAAPTARAETVEVRLTHDGLNWSNALHYTYRDEAAAAEEAGHLVSLMALLTPIIEESCVAAPPAAPPAELMDGALPPAQQLMGGVLSLLQVRAGGAGERGRAARDPPPGGGMVRWGDGPGGRVGEGGRGGGGGGGGGVRKAADDPG